MCVPGSACDGRIQPLGIVVRLLIPLSTSSNGIIVINSLSFHSIGFQEISGIVITMPRERKGKK